tara:strand:- start:2522 stop:2695 length:174 start_codon:yes stop_codon:yes gene_type:complete
MTTIAYNLIASPFAGLGKKIMTKLEIIGYARAAAHLANHGFHEEAKKCVLEAARLQK